MSWKKKIKKWWDGEFIAWENDPQSSVTIIGGKTKHHWTAKLARQIVDFMKNEYKWIIGTIIAIVAIISGLLKVG